MKAERNDRGETSLTAGNGAGLSRRTLLAAAAAAGLAPLVAMRSGRAQSAGVLKALNINHCDLLVTDLAASNTFFQRVFGTGPLRTVLPNGAGAYSGDFGAGAMVTFQVRPKGGTSAHFDIGIPGFQPRRDGKALKDAGFDVRSERDEYVSMLDPDGIPVQIGDPHYTGVCDYCDRPSVPNYVGQVPLLQARAIKYINLKVTDLAKSAAFYRKAFSLPAERTLKGRPGKSVAVDIGSSFLLFDQDPGATVRINHFCLSVDRLRPKDDAARLKAAGIAVEQNGDILMITGPDNAKIAVADSGWMG